MIASAAIVFAAMFALDYVWAFYTRAVTSGTPSAAGAWAVAIVIFNATVTLGYVQSAWMILPAAAGAFAGTFIAVRFPSFCRSGAP